VAEAAVFSPASAIDGVDDRPAAPSARVLLRENAFLAQRSCAEIAQGEGVLVTTIMHQVTRRWTFLQPWQNCCTRREAVANSIAPRPSAASLGAQCSFPRGARSCDLWCSL